MKSDVLINQLIERVNSQQRDHNRLRLEMAELEARNQLLFKKHDAMIRKLFERELAGSLTLSEVRAFPQDDRPQAS